MEHYPPMPLPNNRPPLEKTQRTLALGAAIVLPPLMFGSFFWPILKGFFQSSPGGKHPLPLPLVIFCGFFVLMYLGGIIGMWFKLRTLNRISAGSVSGQALPRAAGLGGVILLSLFALPFAGFGVFALGEAVRKLLAGNLHDAGMFAVFGVVFSGVGFGLVYGAIRARNSSRLAAARAAREPARPWLWRDDWAAGKIKSTALTQMKVLLFMGVMFCGIGGALTVGVLPKAVSEGHEAAVVVLIFPIVGIVMLGFCLRAWRSQRRFGECIFELATIPGALGGHLEGMIQTGAVWKPEHGLHLKLACIRRLVTGSGDNRSTTETILWQDEKVIAPETGLPQTGPGRTAIPVFFKLPGNQPPCSQQGNETILWRLTAKAKMTGPDFSAIFEVPVYQVAGVMPVKEEVADPTAALQMPMEDLRREEGSRIQVTGGPGGREFFFPAARNPGAAAFMTLMAVIFGGIAWAAHKYGAPVLFPIAFGVVASLMAIGCVNLWLRSHRVTINPTRVTAMSRWLVFRRSREFASRDIVRVETKAGMVSGSTVFYDLQLITNGGKRITVAGSMASQPEANWLAQEMTRALGRK